MIDLQSESQKFKSFLESATAKAKKDVGAQKVSCVGLIVAPVDGAILYCVHTGTETDGCVTEYSHLNISDYCEDAWQDEMFAETTRIKNAKGVVVDCTEGGDKAVHTEFVQWAAPILDLVATSASWPFGSSILCVEPAGTDPVVRWTPGQLPSIDS